MASHAAMSLPVDVLADAPDDIFLALRAEGMTVVVDSEAGSRPNPVAKAEEHLASVTFRLAEPDLDACGAPGEVGPFALTITDGLVTLDRESVALDSRAQLAVRGGRFEVCAETRADFDGSIALGAVSFEFGRLPGDVSVRFRGRLYHFPFATTLLLSLLATLLLHFL
jgi:hypothetical protein